MESAERRKMKRRHGGKWELPEETTASTKPLTCELLSNYPGHYLSMYLVRCYYVGFVDANQESSCGVLTKMVCLIQILQMDITYFNKYEGPFGIILESPLLVREYIKARKELQVQQLVKEKADQLNVEHWDGKPLKINHWILIPVIKLLTKTQEI